MGPQRGPNRATIMRCSEGVTSTDTLTAGPPRSIAGTRSKIEGGWGCCQLIATDCAPGLRGTCSWLPSLAWMGLATPSTWTSCSAASGGRVRIWRPPWLERILRSSVPVSWRRPGSTFRVAVSIVVVCPETP